MSKPLVSTLFPGRICYFCSSTVRQGSSRSSIHTSPCLHCISLPSDVQGQLPCQDDITAWTITCCTAPSCARCFSNMSLLFYPTYKSITRCGMCFFWNLKKFGKHCASFFISMGCKMQQFAFYFVFHQN